MKEYLQLKRDSLSVGQYVINMHVSLVFNVFLKFSFKTRLNNKNTQGFMQHTMWFSFPKVKCIKTG